MSHTPDRRRGIASGQDGPGAWGARIVASPEVTLVRESSGLWLADGTSGRRCAADALALRAWSLLRDGPLTVPTLAIQLSGHYRARCVGTIPVGEIATRTVAILVAWQAQGFVRWTCA
jgi:hypothetical protein